MQGPLHWESSQGSQGRRKGGPAWQASRRLKQHVWRRDNAPTLTPISRCWLTRRHAFLFVLLFAVMQTGGSVVRW